MELSDAEKNNFNCNESDLKELVENDSANEVFERYESSSLRNLSIRDIVDITEPHGSLSVSVVLHYCENKILRPYLRLLSIMGLQHLSIDSEFSHCSQILNYLYTFQVIFFVILGYFLQYMACFRRDRGFCYQIHYFHSSSFEETYEKICYGSFIFSFLIPSIIHFFAYLYAIYLFRISNNENLQSLMERVFLSSSQPSYGSINQRKLLKILWIFIATSIIWIILSFILVNVMLFQSDVSFKWIHSDSKTINIILKILLAVCTLWQDMIQSTIITSYCLQAQLLTSYLYFLKAKLILQPIRCLNWMKEMLEFKNLLKYLNKHLAPAVCLFTIINISWCASGIIWLLDYDNIDKSTLPIVGISILNVSLWLLIIIVPFIQAARLTNACLMIQKVGHEVRTRPFAHQETPSEELDSTLLYTSSLKISAILFCVPITGKYLCLALVISFIVVLTLGQCHFFQP